jgi:phage portal protein BeeE
MPDRVTVIDDPVNIIGGYFYDDGTGVSKEYALEQMIHFMLPNPADLGLGIGRIQAAGKLIDAILSSLEWQKTSLDNGAIPSSVIMLEGTPNEAAQVASVKLFQKQYGGPQKARQPMILFGAKGVQNLSHSAVEMDYVNSRKALHQELLAALDVNQEMVKWTADSKFDNFDRAVMDFLVNSVIPLLDTIRRAINAQIKSDYPGYRLGYDITVIEPYRAVSMERVKQVKELQGTGMPVRTISDYLGLAIPPFQGDNIPYITQNMFQAMTENPRDKKEREAVGTEL